MNSTLTQEELERILNQAVQDVTERTAGVRLHQEDMSPGEVQMPGLCETWFECFLSRI